MQFIYSNNKSEAGISFNKNRIKYWDIVACGALTGKEGLHNYLTELEGNGYKLKEIVKGV